jgi:hypothetical protein
MISASSCVRPSRRVMFQVLDDEAVLLNVSNGQYYGVNEVGARFWVLAGERASLGSIYEALLAEFEVTPEQLWQDLVRLAEELCAEGLLEIDDDPTG